MKNIINFINEEKRSIKEFPFNDVDSLILSSLSYFHFNGLVGGINDNKNFILFKNIDISNTATLCKGLLYKKDNIKLLNGVQKSSRYSNLLVNYYEEIDDYENEEQFGAITFILDNFIYVAFRGTDATLLGWKEDFNMAYMCPVPAQKRASNYLNKVMSMVGGNVFVGGHSKGGNLAIYSVMHTGLINLFRIRKVFSHDGPGFRKNIYNSIRYKAIKSKISKTVPSSSIIGMIMFSREDIKIIKSSSFSIFQHNQFSWNVVNGDFIYQDKLADDSKFMDETISSWLNEINDEKRRLFVNTLFSILSNDEFVTIMDIKKNWYKYYKSIKNNVNKLDNESRKIIDEVLNRLVYYGFKNLSIR